MRRSCFVNVLEQKSVTVNGHVFRKFVKRAMAMEVSSGVEGRRVAQDCFCQIDTDRMIGGQLVAEFTVVEDVRGECRALTTEFDLDDWAKSHPDQLKVAQERVLSYG